MKIRHQLLVYFLLACGASSAGYAVLSRVLPWPVFGNLYRMFTYHEAHPYQYIALVAVAYSVIATVWASIFGWRQRSWVRWLSIFMIIPMTILVASFPGGVLWSLHDMEAGFVPSFWPRKMLNDGISGLQVGWLIICLSFPFNCIGTIVAVLVTDCAEKTMRRTNVSSVTGTRGTSPAEQESRRESRSAHT